MRNRKKRQKLRSGVKKRSRKSGIAAETVQRCKQKVRAEGENRKCEQSTEPEETEPEEATESLQRSKETVAKRRNSDRKFTAARTEGADRKCGQKARSRKNGKKFTAE